jgi:hypothetical protein
MGVVPLCRSVELANRHGCECAMPRRSKVSENGQGGFSTSGEPRACNESIQRTLEMTERMLHLAQEGDRVREDVGCGILYAVVRDSAYKIRRLAEAERDAHVKKGWWHT